jgi:hypothetical protein
LARNALLNLAGQVIPLVVAVAAIPFIVRGLGPAHFGIVQRTCSPVGAKTAARVLDYLGYVACYQWISLRGLR